MKKSYIGLSLVLPCYLLAQNVALDDVQVVGQVTQTTNTMNIDLQKAEQQQVNSFFDLFKKDSSTQVGGGATNVKRIYLRGIESSSLNISLDGAKQGKNIFQHRGNELGMNPDLLKVVDVRTSPDASKGGSLGGSISMTTKDAHDFAQDGKQRGGILKAGYNTNTSTKLGSLTLYEAFNQNFGIVANISGVNHENYTDGNDDEMYGTAYKDREYFVKFSMRDVKDQNLNVSISQNENSGDFQWGRSGSDAGVHDPDGPNPLEEIVSTTTTYALEHTYNPSDKLINLQTNLNLSTVNVNRKDNDKEFDNDTFGAKIQNHFNFELLNAQNDLSFGIEYEDQQGVGEFTPTSRKDDDGNGGYIDYAGLSKYADVNSNAKSVFLQNKMNYDALNIYYGARFDDFEFETGLGKATDTTLSPNLGLDYELNEASKIYANYGESSRMTGIIPFTWMNHIKKDTTYSSELEAETSTKYEVGYKYHTDSLLAADDFFSFDVNLFKTEIENLIIARDMNGGSGEGGRTIEDIYNSTNAFESEGFELKIGYNYDKYFTNIAYSNINSNSTDDDANSDTGVNESITIRRVGTYDTEKFVFNGGVQMTETVYVDYTLNAVAGINDTVERAGYVTHDASMKFQTSVDSDWTYFVGVDNITDKYYGSHSTIDSGGNYRREMGRDYKFTVKYVF